MLKIDKRYTIKFGYAGVNQYATFYEKDGKLANPRLSVNWMKVKEKPSVEGLETIEEVLTVIQGISKRAEIHLINGVPLNYYNNVEARDYIKNFNIELVSFLESRAIDFFEKILEPIFKENKWFIGRSHYGFPVIIIKDSEGEWDNIERNTKEFDIDYLCYQFVKDFKDVEAVVESESTSNYSNGFRHFVNLIPQKYFEEKGYYIEVD